MSDRDRYFRFLKMLAIGESISTVFFTNLVYVDIVRLWEEPANAFEGRVSPASRWDLSTKADCGCWLLDTYAKQMFPNNNRGISNVFGKSGDLYQPHSGALQYKIAGAAEANIRAGDIEGLSWLLTSQFWCDERIKQHPTFEKEFSGIQALYDLNELCGRLSLLPEWSITMSNEVYNRMCDLAEGELVLKIRAVLDMTVDQVERLGRPEALDALIDTIVLGGKAAFKRAVREAAEPPQKKELLWENVLEKLVYCSTLRADPVFTRPLVIVPPPNAGCVVTLEQIIGGTAHPVVQSYEVANCDISVLYAGTELHEPPHARLPGWSAGVEHTHATFASRVHCSMTDFNVLNQTCMLTNVSRWVPLYVETLIEHGMVRTTLARGDRRALFVGTSLFVLHVRRGRDPPVELSTMIDGIMSEPMSIQLQEAQVYDLVINIVENRLTIRPMENYPEEWPLLGRIIVRAGLDIPDGWRIDVTELDPNVALYDCVLPSQHREICAATQVRLGLQLRFAIQSIQHTPLVAAAAAAV